MLKALSEGTILLDRRRALRFASGYIEVNVDDRSPEEGEEEATIGRVVVQQISRHDSYSVVRDMTRNSTSSDEESQTQETFAPNQLTPQSAVPQSQPETLAKPQSNCNQPFLIQLIIYRFNWIDLTALYSFN